MSKMVRVRDCGNNEKYFSNKQIETCKRSKGYGVKEILTIYNFNKTFKCTKRVIHKTMNKKLLTHSLYRG